MGLIRAEAQQQEPHPPVEAVGPSQATRGILADAASVERNANADAAIECVDRDGQKRYILHMDRLIPGRKKAEVDITRQVERMVRAQLATERPARAGGSESAAEEANRLVRIIRAVLDAIKALLVAIFCRSAPSQAADKQRDLVKAEEGPSNLLSDVPRVGQAESQGDSALVAQLAPAGVKAEVPEGVAEGGADSQSLDSALAEIQSRRAAHAAARGAMVGPGAAAQPGQSAEDAASELEDEHIGADSQSLDSALAEIQSRRAAHSAARVAMVGPQMADEAVATMAVEQMAVAAERHGAEAVIPVEPLSPEAQATVDRGLEELTAELDLALGQRREVLEKLRAHVAHFGKIAGGLPEDSHTWASLEAEVAAAEASSSCAAKLMLLRMPVSEIRGLFQELGQSNERVNALQAQAAAVSLQASSAMQERLGELLDQVRSSPDEQLREWLAQSRVEGVEERVAGQCEPAGAEAEGASERQRSAVPA